MSRDITRDDEPDPEREPQLEREPIRERFENYSAEPSDSVSTVV
jgi:hypothetical protein